MATHLTFTQSRIDSIKPSTSRFIAWDTKNSGLGLRVTPGGTRSFVYVYRFNRRPRMLTLGNTPPLSLEQATAEYSKARAKIAQARHVMIHEAIEPSAELDPASTKRAKKEAARVAPTFESVWQTYAEKRLTGARPRTRKEYDRMMKVYVLPSLGQRKMVEIRPRDIKAMLNDVEEGGKVMANRTHTLVAAVFNYAAAQFIIDSNPVKLVRRPAKEQPRSRALGKKDGEELREKELRGFLTAVDAMQGDPRVRIALLLVLATAARPGEVTSIRWQDLDLEHKVWRLPADFTKTDEARTIPLSEFAVQRIEDARVLSTDRTFVFGGRRDGEPMSRWKLSIEVSTQRALFTEHGVEPFTPHDLRRTARTWLAKLGVDESIAERVLGHVWGNKIVRTYDVYGYLEEVRGALDKWGAYLTAMRAGPNVRAMRAAA